MTQDQLGLFDTPPDRRQVRCSLAIVGLLIAAFLLLLPVRDVRLREMGGLVPTADAVMFVGDLITASLLYAQASVFRSRALTVLATGYVYTALLFVTHALVFPGAFAPEGLLGGGINTPSWLATFRRGMFPIAVILYVQLQRLEAAPPPDAERPGTGIAVGIIVAAGLAAAATLLATRGHDLLPAYFFNRSDAAMSRVIGYEAVILALFVVATTLLYRTRRSVLDMWLLVACSAWMLQSLLIMTLQSRFTAGWYGLYVVSLFAHLVVTLALMAESNRLYVRLALSTSARTREREARLMSIDAVTAAISHEVGQPLAAVSTHAKAGLNWLTRPQPDVDKAIRSLRAIADAGQRTTEVVRSIRGTFGRRPGRTVDFSLNDLARSTASLLRRELAGEKVSLRFELDEALPPILADRVQIQRVLVNLLTNATESLAATRGRPRRITIRTARIDDEDVLLEVSDNGVGIAPEDMGQIFEAFFTTKPTGTGLGLSLCRTIVETHGGHLWATPGATDGVTFHLRLPRRGLRAL